MKIQDKAVGILERTSHYLKAGTLRDKPVWFDVVGSHPPLMDLTRRPKKFETKAQEVDPVNELFEKNSKKFFKTRTTAHDRRQKHKSIFRVPKLEFLEDQLRDVFYHQHPWEFSRPKSLIENDGKENVSCDWSHMLQWNKPLDGESVVQRTLWLLEDAKKRKEPKSLFEAYDIARFEFYRLRMEEEMNSIVSREESSMLGAVYPTTHMESGIEHEQEYIDVWTKVASERTKVKEASKTGKASIEVNGDDAVDAKQSIWESHLYSDIDGSLDSAENSPEVQKEASE